MADIIVSKIFKQPVFAWGSDNLVRQGESRKAYLNAIKAADKGDILSLINFSRT